MLLRVGEQSLARWNDVLLGPVFAHDREKLEQLRAVYGRDRLGARKRQLSSADLRRLGLVNAVD